MTLEPLEIPPLVQAFLTEVALPHDSTIKILRKSESKVQRAIAWLVKPFNPEYLNSYITTVGSTIYVPDNFFSAQTEASCVETISHELQHIIDTKTLGRVKFSLAYAFPQILAVLSLLSLGAIWNLHMLWFLLTLLFLAPLPAPWRYKFEKNGYRTAFLFRKYVSNYNESGNVKLRAWVTEQLAGRWYYYAWPFPAMIDKDFKDWTWLEEPRYKDILAFYTRKGFVKTSR